MLPPVVLSLLGLALEQPSNIKPTSAARNSWQKWRAMSLTRTGTSSAPALGTLAGKITALVAQGRTAAFHANSPCRNVARDRVAGLEAAEDHGHHLKMTWGLPSILCPHLGGMDHELLSGFVGLTELCKSGAKLG